MTTWFTADFHFGHYNIIKFCNRPFETVRDMNETLIANYNSKVGKYDHVWIIGDFCFGSKNVSQEIFNRLNGVKHLVTGNHDKTSLKLAGWASTSDYKELKLGKQNIVMFHYAMRVWNKSHYGTWQLYGHSHGNLPDDPNALAIDVGVDCHNYYPLSVEEISDIMSKKTWTSPLKKGV